MWVTGFDIRDRRATQPHPHQPVSQPPLGVDVTAAPRWTNIKQVVYPHRLGGGFPLRYRWASVPTEKQRNTSQPLCSPPGAR